jgi:hypothetical protein
VAKNRRSTGLGTDIFFQPPASQPQPAKEPEADDSPLPPDSEPPEVESGPEKKIRTTVTLYPQTLAAMESLKVHARRQGQRATYSDILEEAIQDLARKRGIDL